MQTRFRVLILPLCLLLPVVAQGKRFPADLPEAAREEILATESALGLDVVTGIIANEYSAGLLETLLGGLSSEFTAVQERHLELLASFIEQSQVPDSALRGEIIPTLTLFILVRMSSSVALEEDPLLLLARRAQWHAIVQGIPQTRQRLAFLGEHVRIGLHDGLYYSSEALDYIADLADEEAIELLKRKLADVTPSGSPRDLLQALRWSLERAQMTHRLRQLRADERTKELATLLAERRTQLTTPAAGSFMTWLLRELEELGDPQAVEVLKEIWHDAGYGDRYRYGAQEALVNLGYLEPGARTIMFDF